jgi:hypothetical protein
VAAAGVEGTSTLVVGVVRHPLSAQWPSWGRTRSTSRALFTTWIPLVSESPY